MSAFFLHILVVDDDVDVCAVVCGMLEDMDYRVSVAKNNTDARAILDNNRIDLLIADQLLRGERGLDLATYAQTLGIPSILISGDGDSIEELEVGQYVFLSKPFRLREFYEKIGDALSKPKGALDGD